MRASGRQMVEGVTSCRRKPGARLVLQWKGRGSNVFFLQSFDNPRKSSIPVPVLIDVSKL